MLYYKTQQKRIYDVLQQWVYRPYLVNGQPVEVDTNALVPMRKGTPLVVRGFWDIPYA